MVQDPKQLERERPERLKVLWLSTIGFTVMFAVWLMFGVLGSLSARSSASRMSSSPGSRRWPS